jgi:flagellar biosynthesis anti-sigma factor FlgM
MIQIKDSLGIESKPLESKREKPSAPARVATGESQAAARDKVMFSEKSKEAARAAEIVAATPPSRQEKIEQIREAIANNQYQVSSEQLAERMITDFLKGI